MEGNFNNLSGINAVVDSYNTSRPWLDKEMKDFSYLDGMTVCLGTGLGHAWFDMEYGFRSQKRAASGTDLYGFFNTRELKMKNNNFALTIGGVGGNTTGMGVGLRTEFGMLKLKTRVYGESSPKEKLEDLLDPRVSLKAGPMIKLFGVVAGTSIITGSIYYTWSLLRYNVSDVDTDLNNNDYNYVEQPQFELRPSSFGFNISVGIAMAG